MDPLWIEIFRGEIEVGGGEMDTSVDYNICSSPVMTLESPSAGLIVGAARE